MKSPYDKIMLIYYSTGICGSTAVLEALVRRAEHGGSYGVDVS